MSDKPANGKTVSPTTMLGGRASFAYLGGVAIVITDVQKWTDAEVMEMVNKQAELVGHVSAQANITHFYGDIFGATHRKMIVDWIESNGLKASSRTAMVTDSKIMRAALTAYAWMTKTESKAFELKDRQAMCEWIVRDMGIDAAEIKVLLESCYKLLNKSIG
ncbi:MAG TPA: STAS/SEC14 domain-containing protein [Pseudomonadales bacterium]|nr:STAS/SEC14 domain-containing protein [Pseudomonadales bacterium]